MKYKLNNALNILEKHIQVTKEEALKITNEKNLNNAYIIMTIKPLVYSGYYSDVAECYFKNAFILSQMRLSFLWKMFCNDKSEDYFKNKYIIKIILRYIRVKYLYSIIQETHKVYKEDNPEFKVTFHIESEWVFELEDIEDIDRIAEFDAPILFIQCKHSEGEYDYTKRISINNSGYYAE